MQNSDFFAFHRFLFYRYRLLFLVLLKRHGKIPELNFYGASFTIQMLRCIDHITL